MKVLIGNEIGSIECYPFGMAMGGRDSSIAKYRVGFDGQERDEEVGSSRDCNYTANYWEYNSRIGRRMNADPLIKSWLSSYCTFSNNPILMVDPLGNTDFYWKGKWIGTDGLTNGLIALVKSKDIKNQIVIASKLGLNSNDYGLSNGEANSQFNVIHIDILKESSLVLQKAITTRKDFATEHRAVLKENSAGGFDRIFEGAEGKIVTDSKGGTRTSGGSYPDGDIRIHSHPIGTELHGIIGSSYDATAPTICDPLTGGDMCDVGKYKLDIIVGKNGIVTPDADNHGNFIMRDSRELSINVFGSDDLPKFSIPKEIADLILAGEKNRKAKESFTEKHKSISK